MKQFSVHDRKFKRIFARVRLHYRIEVGKCVATKSQQQTQKVTLSLWFDQLVVFLGMDRDVNYSHVLGLESRQPQPVPVLASVTRGSVQGVPADVNEPEIRQNS